MLIYLKEEPNRERLKRWQFIKHIGFDERSERYVCVSG